MSPDFLAMADNSCDRHYVTWATTLASYMWDMMNQVYCLSHNSNRYVFVDNGSMVYFDCDIVVVLLLLSMSNVVDNIQLNE
jgi:hypothetical protein